jgi:hypothetical protein
MSQYTILKAVCPLIPIPVDTIGFESKEAAEEYIQKYSVSSHEGIVESTLTLTNS